MDSDFFRSILGGGATLTAAITLLRLFLDYHLWRRQQRDAASRLERLLQERLLEADRRLKRSDADLREERLRSARLEHELAALRQAHDLLRLECAALAQAANAQRLRR